MPLIRPFQPKDTNACHRVFYNAVRMGAASAYSESERAAWAPSPTPPDHWCEKLGDHITYVAELDEIVGFMTIGEDGHLDLAYVSPGHMGQGIGKALYRAILNDTRAASLSHLSTEASHLARPFFRSLGWQEEAQQTVERRGVLLTNFRMFKTQGAQP